MNSLEECLNDHLDHLAHQGQHPGRLLLLGAESAALADLRELLVLAQHLRQHPQLQVTPEFARKLECRVVRHAEQCLQQGRSSFSWRALLCAHRVLGSVLVACLFCCLFGTSLFALAAQARNSDNPLYGLKRWEQQVQIQFAGPDEQATMHLGLAHDDLTALSSLVRAHRFQEYDQTVRDLNQQVQEADVALANVPAGSSHDHLVRELASFKLALRQTLRYLLAELPFSERLTTTTVLANNGENVPQLTSAAMILPARLPGRATIRLEGTHLVASAQLVIDGRMINGAGTLHDGQITFVVNWDSNQPPQSLGILNPDGTAAQMTVITILQSATSGQNTGNSNGNDTGKKPTSTPTPGRNQPSSTPTPGGKKPSNTPTHHH